MAEILRSGQIGRMDGERTVVTIGVFDGVHLGHRKVIRALAEEKERTGARSSVLMTFDRHPLSVVRSESSPRLLTTLDEKLSILQNLEIDLIFVQEFDAETAATSYRRFIEEKLMGRFGMECLVVGYDFHLGRGREGNQGLLEREGERLGFGVKIVPPVVVRGSAVSSTRIRRYIEERKLRRAAGLLTQPYFFDAEVERGEGVGRAIGFPTANVRTGQRDKLLPPRGVYAVRVMLDGATLDGMMNVGTAPTVQPGSRERIEINLFDFSGELYGRSLRVQCIDYLREEKKFADRTALQAQLVQDREKAMAALEKIC